jgi:hypothetical protein
MSPETVPPPSANRPLRWMATIYAILALTMFAFPAGLRDWLEERDAGGKLWLPLTIARQIEAASDAVGVKPVGARLKAWFAALVGEGDG